MKTLVVLLILLSVPGASAAAGPELSNETKSCLGCHVSATPGIVGDWRASRHSSVTPSEALAVPAAERRFSATSVDPELGGVAVGCYECHGLNTEDHGDSFKHYGFSINVVVSPRDCAACHPVEAEQYSVSKKANAYGNIHGNSVYRTLIKEVIGLKELKGRAITSLEPSDFTRQDACYACHGTEVRVSGMKGVETAFGRIEVPDLANWPNQGVGRINPDGTKGACTPCHARHEFSIEVARKPYTCGQCHLEPDVPAWNVYKESKHGNVFESKYHEWDFRKVPWVAGRDFTAPTCSVCHVSLIAGPDGSTIAERSHDFGSRLWVRIFGLVYTHPQPKAGDTTTIRNEDGLPLPTTFSGRPASGYLIDPGEQGERKGRMTSVCRACHSTSWVEAHFEKMNNTLEETDRMTLAATGLISEAWRSGVADGSNPFDEALERKWVKQWLFYGNTARYASAMTGAQDYVAFKYGWWGLSANLFEMRRDIDTALGLKGGEEEE